MVKIKGGILGRFKKSSYLYWGKNFFCSLFRHSRENGNPEHIDFNRFIDTRLRGYGSFSLNSVIALKIVTYCRTMIFGSVFIACLLTLSFVFAAEPVVNQATPTGSIANTTTLHQANSEQPNAAQNNSLPQFSGELFGIQVPLQNNYFINGVLAVFGNKWGPQPQTEEELKKVVWDQLLMSFEAFRRGVVVNQEEINQEVNKIIAVENVDFDWKKDRAAYEKWVKNKTNESVEIFEGQLKHLIQIQKLRQQVMDSVEPPVSEEEAYQEFSNENNNLSVELVQFDQKKDADIFYNKARGNAKFWDQEKEKRPKDFKRPGAVSLEFLIDMWGFPKNACYKMMKIGAGQIYPADTIYKGYGVFKVLSKGLADKSRYAKWKTGYYDQIKNKKKLEALGKWFEDLKKQANLKIYDKPREG